MLDVLTAAGDESLIQPIAISLAGWGQETRLRLDPPAGVVTPKDITLIQLIARGFAARDELLAMDADTARQLPVARQRHLERIARLAYLAPDIIRAILDGRQPRHMSARNLSRTHGLPNSWADQRAVLGIAQG